MSGRPTSLSLGLRTVSEVRTPVSLPVRGVLPAYLSVSTLYRQGPGRYEAEHSDGKPLTIRHWFDGFALVHAFAIDASDNRVTYRSNFISKALISAAESTAKAKFAQYTFGRDDPCKTIFAKFMQLFLPAHIDPVTGKPAANVNVTLQTVPGKGDLVARTDHRPNFVLNRDTLEPEEFFVTKDLASELDGPFTAAHGQFDHGKGEFWNYAFDVKGPEVVYKVFKVGKDGKGVVMGEKKDKPAYIHSFALTENYMILIVWPLYYNVMKLVVNRSLMDSMQFAKNAHTRFHVFKRDGSGYVGTYQSNPFYCFHTVNAYEKMDSIVIDLSRYDDATVLDHFQLDYMRTATTIAPSSLSRFTLEQVSSLGKSNDNRVAKEQVLNSFSIELPRINPDFHMKEHRYVYAVSAGEHEAFTEIVKIDVLNNQRTVWKMEHGVVGEPIFVKDPNGQNEDDGCLLVVVLMGDMEKSCLMVLDARNLKEIARAEVPQIVPLGFHGKYIAE